MQKSFGMSAQEVARGVITKRSGVIGEKNDLRPIKPVENNRPRQFPFSQKRTCTPVNYIPFIVSGL